MERIGKIQMARPSHSNYGGTDIYGTSIRIKPHFTRSLYSRMPIYQSDANPYGYPYGYPYYGYYPKPPSGGIFAADGVIAMGHDQRPPEFINDKDKFIANCVKNKVRAIPSGVHYAIDPAIIFKMDCEKQWNDRGNSSSAKELTSDKTPRVIGGLLGGVAGYLASRGKKKEYISGEIILGTLLGIGVGAGIGSAFEK